MNIIGEKIILRAVEKKDLNNLKEMINSPDIENMVGGISFPVSDEQQEQWFLNLPNKKDLRLIIDSKNSKEMVGTIILTDIDYINGNAEIHIKLLNDSVKGKGYGSEAISLICNYAKKYLRLHLIYANILYYNDASNRLFKKMGFEMEGVLKDRIFKDGKYNSIVCYSKTI